MLIFDEDSRERFLTGEKNNLIVDYYVNWRIIDPAQYYRAVGGDEDTGRAASVGHRQGRHSGGDRPQNTPGSRVGGAHRASRGPCWLRVQERSPELGIEVLDVRVKRIDLVEDVSESVFSRMRQERVGAAAQLRSEGEEEYVRVRADAERQRTVTWRGVSRCRAYSRRRRCARGRGLCRTHTAQDREFDAFDRSMQAYRESIGSDQDGRLAAR